MNEKKNPTPLFNYRLSTRDTVQIQIHKWVKVKRCKKIYGTKSNQKRGGLIIHIVDIIDVNKECSYRQGMTFYGDKRVNTSKTQIIINIYACNNKVPFTK